MDEYLKRNEERIRKMVLHEKIIELVNNPNYSEIILQNQQNGVVCTQNALRNMTESNEIYKKLKQKTNTQPQTI